jgi:hypothetical protein
MKIRKSISLIYVFGVLLLSPLSMQGQSSLSQFQIHAGLRLYNPRIITAIPGFQLHLASNPELGLAWYSKNRKFGVKYRRVIGYGAVAGEINYPIMYESAEAGSRFDEHNELDIYFAMPWKSFAISGGVGISHKSMIDKRYFISQGWHDTEFSMWSLSAQIPFEYFNLEFKKLFMFAPVTKVFESYLYAISINRELYLSKDWKNRNARINRIEGVKLFPVFSMRMQAIKYYKDAVDLFNPVGLVPGVSIETYFERFNTSVVLGRDFWVKYTGGLRSNDIIGNIITNTIGVNYYLKPKKEQGKTAVIGLSYHPIYNFNEPRRTVVRSFDVNGTVLETRVPKDVNVMGLGVSFAYHLGARYFLEVRQIMPFVGDEPFLSPYYTSVGVSYRLMDGL